MRGSDHQRGSLYSYVSLEARVPAEHPLRRMRELVGRASGELSGRFKPL
jgi:hypothetical protein